MKIYVIHSGNLHTNDFTSDLHLDATRQEQFVSMLHPVENQFLLSKKTNNLVNCIIHRYNMSDIHVGIIYLLSCLNDI